MDEQVSFGSKAFAFIDQRFIDQRIELDGMFEDIEAAKISNAVFHFQVIPPRSMSWYQSHNLQFGRARLYFKRPLHGPWVWDTPSPAIRNVSIFSDHENASAVAYRTPDLMPLDQHTAHSLLQLFGSLYERRYETRPTTLCINSHRLHMFTHLWHRISRRYFHTSLRQATGLTFFFREHRFYGAHIHTAEMPSAANFLERLPWLVRPRVSWVYVPLPPGDDIVAMGHYGPGGGLMMVRNPFFVSEFPLTFHVVDSKKTQRRYFCRAYSWSSAPSLYTS